jgi:hypothetical protein
MFSCKAVCQPNDPATDTVKVNFPVEALTAEEDLREQEEEAERQRQQEEAEKLRWEAEMEAKAKAAAEAEAARLIAEEERLVEEARQAELAFEAEQLRQGELAEAARLEEEARVESRKATVAAFLKQHGFSDVSAPRRKFLKTKYPIHKAAKEGDSSLVEMLLLEGADPKQKDSRGKTAAQVAHAKDSKGSHSSVIALLGGSQRQPTAGGA